MTMRNNENDGRELVEDGHDWGGDSTKTSTITNSFVTSETGFSSVFKNDSKSKSLESAFRLKISKYVSFVFFVGLSFVAFFSPFLMIVIPKLELNNWKTDECKSECEGILLSFIIKSLLLGVGTWVLYWRKPEYNLPRITACKAFLVILIFIITSLHWLFYGVKFLATTDSNYLGIVSFASAMNDCLLFVHYLGVVLIEIKQRTNRFVIKIVRSPDGYSKCYHIGQLSVQRLAVWCLNKYCCDFDHYNMYLDKMLRQKSRSRSFKTSAFKLYNLDTSETPLLQGSYSRPNANQSHGRRENATYNDKYYQEEVLEKKIRKRKSRLMNSAEEAFNNIRRLQLTKENTLRMSQRDAAQAIFAGLANPLQKYLRVTRQQPKYTVESIVQHITQCLAYDLSAKVFVEKYTTQGKVIYNEERIQNWVIVSKLTLNRGIYDGAEFCLKKGDISLIVTVTSLPFYHVFEEEYSSDKRFIINLNEDETKI